MPAGATYSTIATQTLGSAASSVTFSSIPGTYTDLVLVANAGTSAADNYYAIRFNSDTNTNYSNTALYGNGTSAASNRNSNTDLGYLTSTSSGSLKDNVIINIQNYSNATTYKTALVRGNVIDYRVMAHCVLWRSTSAITSITILSGSNMLSGSSFSLYGVAAA